VFVGTRMYEILRGSPYYYSTYPKENSMKTKVVDKTLMELVDSCQLVTDKYVKLAPELLKSMELEALGFKKLAKNVKEEHDRKDKLNKLRKGKYVEITEKDIQKYLEKRWKRVFGKKWKKKTDRNGSFRADDINVWTHGGSAMMLQPGNYMASFAPNIRIWQDIPEYKSSGKKKLNLTYTENGDNVLWIEQDIEHYKTFPPQHAIDRVAQEKKIGIFDYYTIAKVKDVEDPLLLGRIKGSDSRFFLDQWGDDVSLDDLL